MFNLPCWRDGMKFDDGSCQHEGDDVHVMFSAKTQNVNQWISLCFVAQMIQFHENYEVCALALNLRLLIFLEDYTHS